jgi:hypothetical protein
MITRLSALAIVLAALVCGAPPAVAATLPKDLAAELRRTPLVVDPSLADAVSAAQRRTVLRAIEAAPYAVWVVLVPLTPGDRYGGDASRFLGVIHGRLGRRGVYVTVDDRLLTYMAVGVDDGHPDLHQASTLGNFESRDYDEPQIEKVRRFVEALRAPDLAARFERTQTRLREAREEFSPPPATTTADDEEGDGATGWLLPVGILAALGVGSALVHWRRRRHARPAPRDEALIPARVFEHAHTAQAGELREQIEERLLAFADRIDRADGPSSEAARERQQHALDAYAAARRVLASDPRMVDLVGALVLVEDGSRALAAAEALEAGRPVPAPAALCFFDPRHPGSTKPVAWKEGLTVPVCGTCRAALRTGHRPPDTLLDDGRPWFETDSLWARTGFGVFEPDLAERVSRGELRRRG